MKSYIQSKIVKARPGTVGEYYKLGGAKCPQDEDPDEEGFIVIENPDTNSEVILFYEPHVFEREFSEFRPH